MSFEEGDVVARGDRSTAMGNNGTKAEGVLRQVADGNEVVQTMSHSIETLHAADRKLGDMLQS
jgi:hypothetical protein